MSTKYWTWAMIDHDQDASQVDLPFLLHVNRELAEASLREELETYDMTTEKLEWKDESLDNPHPQERYTASIDFLEIRLYEVRLA